MNAFPLDCGNHIDHGMTLRDYFAAIDHGMTLRDYFAAKAMQAMISNSNIVMAMMEGLDSRLLPKERDKATREMIGNYSYKWADLMLKAREGR